jgi:hypothetical protein
VRKWLAAACVVLACAAAPLFAPQWWTQHGPFPDLAALTVLWLAISGTPERAALFGVAIGLARSAWTPEPFGLDASLYGLFGWSGAHFGRAVFQDRMFVKVAAAGIGVLALRSLSLGFSSLVAAAPVDRVGVGVGAWAIGALLAAAATALAAPIVFGALSGSRVLVGFERRRARDV